MLLKKSDILNLDDSDYKTIDVPEWSGEVRLKSMSVAEQIEYEKMQTSEDNNQLILTMLVLSIVDENNNRMFDKDDIVLLQEKSAHVICSLFKECIKLNSLTSKDIEDKAKNS